jgi:hypothetical protein
VISSRATAISCTSRRCRSSAELQRVVPQRPAHRLHVLLARRSPAGAGERAVADREADHRAEVAAEDLAQLLALPRHVHLLHGVAEVLQQPRRVVRGLHAQRVDLRVGDRRRRRHRDPQRGGLLRGLLRERRRRRRRPHRVPELRAREDVEQRRRLADGACQDAVDPEHRMAELRCDRDAVALRLEADEAAAGGGDARGSAAVVAVRERHHPRGDGGRAAAGGAPRGAVEVPRVARGAEQPGLADGQDPVLGQRRGADDHEARVAQAAYEAAVVGGDEVLHQLAAEGQAHPFHGDVVLDCDRNAGERARVIWADRVRDGERTLGVHVHERVQLRVELLDALERVLDQLACAQLAAAHERGQLAGGAEHQVGGGHRGVRDYPVRLPHDLRKRVA